MRVFSIFSRYGLNFSRKSEILLGPEPHSFRLPFKILLLSFIRAPVTTTLPTIPTIFKQRTFIVFWFFLIIDVYPIIRWNQ